MHGLRVGNGFDVHRFAPGRDLILGGIKIDHPLGLEGHSDADVLVHSIIDSLLGPSGLGDIGRLFPDTDPAYKNISSIYLLGQVYARLRERGFMVVNTDSIVICEKPKIAQYADMIRQNISSAMNNEVPVDAISVKGKTAERLGFTGRGEGIAVYTVTLLSRG
ncbi:MAG TPA: 2-C-methyl-D-erythritol 2,4-cyclodiphosphate synthase [Spirochaetota bacterium]|nr:2-C-methyl-D-erythritol 2,4-cyclodiphosphate synthase [Spirochaetota bacterium]HQO38894.1 2-C-methyl-D-erythritol 2,4-cyclodiphosphate synthase [Spirochaetota bacterium]